MIAKIVFPINLSHRCALGTDNAVNILGNIAVCFILIVIDTAVSLIRYLISYITYFT